MATDNNTISTLNGMFREVYADRLEDLIPDTTSIFNTIVPPSAGSDGVNLISTPSGTNWVPSAWVDAAYRTPVIMGMEQGFSYPDTVEFSVSDDGQWVPSSIVEFDPFEGSFWNEKEIWEE